MAEEAVPSQNEDRRVFLSDEGAAALVFLLGSQLEKEQRSQILVGENSSGENKINFFALRGIIEALEANQGNSITALFESDDERQLALAQALQLSRSQQFFIDGNEVKKDSDGFVDILEEDQAKLVMQWMGWKTYNYSHLDRFSKNILDKEIKKAENKFTIVAPERVDLTSSIADQVVSRRPNLFQSILRRGQNHTTEHAAPTPLQAGDNRSPEAAAKSAPTAPLQPVSIPTASYQAFEQGAHSERFLIHLLGSQLKGGIGALYSNFDLKDPNILQQIMRQLESEGKDVGNPLSLFGNDVDNAENELQKALRASLEWSNRNDDQINVSRSGKTEMRPVLQVLDDRAPRNILAEDAQKLQNFFLAVFENSSEVDLSAPNAFDTWYNRIKNDGIPAVEIHPERIPAAAMQSGDLSRQQALTASAKLGFVDSVQTAEGKMWEATGKLTLACVVAGASVLVATATGGLAIPIVGVVSMAPIATGAFQVSGLVLAATATGTAATTAVSAGIGVVQAVGDVGKSVVSAIPGACQSVRNGCQYVAGLFNRQHAMEHAR